MADDSIAFSAAQSQHAQDIRDQRATQRFNANATPEEKFAAIARKIGREEGEKAVGRLTIQGGSGQGYNITIPRAPAAPAGGGGSKTQTQPYKQPIQLFVSGTICDFTAWGDGAPTPV